MPAWLGIILAAISLARTDPSFAFPMQNDVITGSFCEFRGNHLHTGIDISTGGSVGMPIIAPSDGWISYIKQDFTGYGKALFMANDSITFVFGHLNGFSTDIEAKLNNARYRQIIYPSKNDIIVHKGDTIAFSGRSGTLYPHLHFEMRSINNNPLNPMNYFNVTDTVYPEIASILIEPADDSSLVCGRHDYVQLKCTKMNKSFYTVNPVSVKGAYKVSFEIIDRINSKTARLFVSDIAMFSGNKEIFRMDIDSVSFSQSPSSPLMFRNELEIKNSYYTFLPHTSHKNWFFSDSAPILYSNVDTIIGLSVMDDAGNRTMLAFRVKDEKENVSDDNYIKIKNIADRINIIFSGHYAESLGIIPPGFKYYSVSDVYKYLVYESHSALKAPYSAAGVDINYNIAYCSLKPYYMSDSAAVQSPVGTYFMYNTEKLSLKGLTAYSPLFNIYYGDHYREKPVSLILKGYAGKSLYRYNGKGKYTFAGKLKDNDTIVSHYLSSFIIGIDNEIPVFTRTDKKNMKNYTQYEYNLADKISGIDWDFVADSNAMYNIPDPIMGNIIIRLPYGTTYDFRIRDKEGNGNIIRLK